MKPLTALLASSFLGLAAVIIVQLWPVSPAAAAGVGVDIRDFAFVPQSVTITAGTAVGWTNRDGVSHTATGDSNAWDSGTLGQNGTFSFIPTQPGTYPYHCAIHPSMRGTVVVQATQPPAGQDAPTLSSPADNERVASFGPALSWSN